MGTLLLRLCGPMQSWGTQSRFSNRDTGLEPSKSGVVGLLCAAMGKPRNTDISDLAELKMGVRIDWPGIIERDYHTALKVAKAGGGTKACEPSNRFYLADACFLVALTGDNELLEEINGFLVNPVWQTYLGRKAFLPGAPVYLKDGFKPEITLAADALRSYPYLCPRHETPPEDLRLELEDERGERVKVDQPLPYSYSDRKFGLRHVRTDKVRFTELPAREEKTCICQS